MKLIDMKDWKGLLTAGDQEDLTGEVMVLKNLEAKPGKLVKTHGPGLKLDEARIESEGKKESMFGTFIHPKLPYTFLYFSAFVYPSTSNIVRHIGWDPDASPDPAWKFLETFFPNYSDGPDRGTWYYQKCQRGNPLIFHGDEFRALCGKLAVSEDYDEPALPLWCGYIKREFFCEPAGGYEPSNNFYTYTAPLVAPAIDITVLELPGGPYNPEGTKYAITSLSADDDTITIAGIHTDILPGDYIRILKNTANNGLYYLVNIVYDTGDTVIEFDPAYFDLVNDTDKDGYVLPFAEGEKKWYKFSYIYDGIQESLMTEDPISVKMDLFDNILPRFEWDIANKTLHNFRITALVVYRSDARDGIYKRIQIVDYIRPADQILGDSRGAFTGHSCAYVPGLSEFSFVDETSYELHLKKSDGSWENISFLGSDVHPNNVFFRDMLPIVEGLGPFRGFDYWDVPWRLTHGSEPVVTDESGSDGAYAGENTIILNDRDIGEGNAAGGVFYYENGPECSYNGNKGSATNAYTHASGDRTRFKTEFYHCLEIGEMVELFEFSEKYNGIYKVIAVPAEDEFVVDCAYTADDAGKWSSAGRERAVDDNFHHALHLTKPYKFSLWQSDGEAYVLMKPHWGLFYAAITDNAVKIRFYDNGITASVPHYLAGEKSIHINGDCAVVVQDILFQGNLYLDPGGKNEDRSNYISFSMPGKLDVNPASRIKRINDREGGNPLVQLELEGNVISVTKFGMTTTRIENPGEPASWKHVQSRHNLGTIARLGCISAVGSIFTPALDGIYRVRPNNLARSDKTPLDVMKITDDIENIYMAMSLAQKQAIVAGYDPLKAEVVFAFSYDQDETHYDSVFAYDVVKGTWREVHTSVIPGASFLDEEGNLLVWDSEAGKIHSFAEDAVLADHRATLRIPYQLISDVREEVVRDVKITYMSASDLVVNVYTEHNEEVFDTFELPASAKPTTYHYMPRTRCKKFALEITEENADYLQTSFGETYLIVARHGGEYPNTEIHRIRIWHD